MWGRVNFTMSAVAEKLMSGLAKLPADDLRQAAARISVLLGGATALGAAAPVADRNEQAVYDAVTDVLKEYGERRTPPLSVARNFAHYPAFRKGAAAVVEYAAEYLKPVSRNAKARAYYILVSVVGRRLYKNPRVPLCHRTLCNGLAAVGEQVEAEFPGYKACGLLPAVLKQKRGKWPDDAAAA